METKERILGYLARHPSARSSGLCEHLGITRQALNVHLRALIEAGSVVKSGSTRAARYSLPEDAPAVREITRDLALVTLDESVVYEELGLLIGLRGELRPNVESIVRYAFTEVLNNAIDHSGSDRCTVTFRLDAGSASFEIRDKGIGVFDSIASKLGLEDEQEAMLELLKGKTTTMKERHSGEGLFFTSKAADRFVLRSHRIRVEWNRSKNDVFASTCRFLRGTDAHFFVHRGTRRRLEEVFGEFAPEAYGFRFSKTKVHVKLLHTDYISRSEAKRLLANLEKFREIVLDFRGVRSIGQAFADEVFRVFARRNPGIEIRAEHANPVVSAMLRHVEKT